MRLAKELYTRGRLTRVVGSSLAVWPCFRSSFPTALGTGIGLGVVCAGRVVTGCRGLIEGGHMVSTACLALAYAFRHVYATVVCVACFVVAWGYQVPSLIGCPPGEYCTKSSRRQIDEASSQEGTADFFTLSRPPAETKREREKEGERKRKRERESPPTSSTTRPFCFNVQTTRPHPRRSSSPARTAAPVPAGSGGASKRTRPPPPWRRSPPSG